MLITVEPGYNDIGLYDTSHVESDIPFFLYGSTALYGPGPPRSVEVSWSHTFETHHSR